MVTLNATVYPGEAYVLVQTDWAGTLLRDMFGRTVNPGWGTPDIGPAYTSIGGIAANFFVNGTQGVIEHTTLADRSLDAPINALNVDFSGVFINTTLPTGGNFEFKFTLRFVDGSNFVQARMFLQPSNTVGCSVRQLVGGVETNGGFPVIAGLPATGVYGFRFVANGSSLLFRSWLITDPEPLIWHGSLTTTMLTAGSLRVGSELTGGVTNPLPVSHQFDNLLAVDPTLPDVTYAGVSRRNTVTGEMVMLRPYIAYDADGNLLLECGQGLWWDTEPPLNVPLEYCAVAADIPTNVVANSSFEGSTAGWTVTGGALAASSTFSHDGLQSGRVTPSGTDINVNISQALAGLTPGPFDMSTWILTPQGWNAVRMRLLVNYTDGHTDSFESPVEILDDAEWRLLQLSGTLDTTVATATLFVYMQGTPPATTLFYIDDVRVTQDVPVASTACETVTVSSESVWLKNPLNPCLDIEIGLCSPMLMDCLETARVSYVGHSDDEYAPNTVWFSPVNQRRLIPVNRIRRDANSTLRILAHDCTARDAVLESNEPGDPLLFQAPATYCIPDRYISVGVLTESRLSVDQREDFRLISLPYVVVNRPEGPANGVCGARIRDLCDIYTSWAAMTIADLTWTDLLLGEASPNGPGQPAPPVGLRTWSDVESTFANWLAVETDGTWADIRDGT